MTATAAAGQKGGHAGSNGDGATGGVVHVVGAGLAGLSTALRLTEAGRTVRLYEATDHAGGRCRSFYDPKLEREIDNGNHLVLTGNASARAYVKAIGAEALLTPQARAHFPFVDLATDRRWTVRLNSGPAPWWVASKARRIPDTRLIDYIRGGLLALARRDATVAETLRGRGPIWTRFWEPLTLAALNTTPEKGAARLLWAVLRETFARGAAYSRPMLAPQGLGRALVDPAVAQLTARGVEIRRKCPLSAVEIEDGRAARLRFSGADSVALGPGDGVVLALAPARLKAVAPGIDAPEDKSAILNAHFVVDDPAALENAAPLLGVLSSKTHWIFVRGDVVSLTISAADALGLAEIDPDEALPLLWAETRAALGLGSASYRAGRLLKEKRATFDQSPEGVARRPKPRTPFSNVFLAGDATDTGLPATIEGAIRSGERAARLAAGVAA